MDTSITEIALRSKIKRITSEVLEELRTEHNLFDQQLTNQNFRVALNTRNTDEFCSEIIFSVFRFVISNDPPPGMTMFSDIKFNIKRCVGIWNAEEQRSWNS